MNTFSNSFIPPDRAFTVYIYMHWDVIKPIIALRCLVTVIWAPSASFELLFSIYISVL